MYVCTFRAYSKSDRHAAEKIMTNLYRVFIKYCVFSLKFCYFSELCQFCCSAGVLPAWCVYTHTDNERKQSPEYFKIFQKNPQYLMNTLYVVCLFFFSTRLELHPYALLWWLYEEWVKASLVCCNKKIFKKSATNCFYIDFLHRLFRIPYTIGSYMINHLAE